MRAGRFGPHKGNGMPDLHVLLVALDSNIEVAARDGLAREGADIAHADTFEQAEKALADAANAAKPFDVAVFAHSRPQAVDAENAAIAALSMSPGCENAQFILLSDDRRGRTHLVLPNCKILAKKPLNRMSLVRAVLDAAGRSDAGDSPALP